MTCHTYLEHEPEQRSIKLEEKAEGNETETATESRTNRQRRQALVANWKKKIKRPNQLGCRAALGFCN